MAAETVRRVLYTPHQADPGARLPAAVVQRSIDAWPLALRTGSRALRDDGERSVPSSRCVITSDSVVVARAVFTKRRRPAGKAQASASAKAC